MKDIYIYCNECGTGLGENDRMLQGSNHAGHFVCEECFHNLEIAKWYKQVPKEDLIDLLNNADYYRWTSFYISFIGGEKKFIVAKESYPSVFSVLVSREELVNLINETV